MNGGYDSGYLGCPCFWGRDPGRLVRHLERYVLDFENLRVLDAGCGEGKNAYFFPKRGSHVRAIDISEAAIANGRAAFKGNEKISWEVADIRSVELLEQFDIVIAYGLLHCLPMERDVRSTIHKLQAATKPNAYNILCALNDRHQELAGAHAELRPTLLSHSTYLDFYIGWEIIEESDADLTEVHPHNNITHTHSLTRILARKA